jgi:hypothetical protein
MPELFMKKSPFNYENLDIYEVAGHRGILGEIPRSVGYLTQCEVAHSYCHQQAANYASAAQIREKHPEWRAPPRVFEIKVCGQNLICMAS